MSKFGWSYPPGAANDPFAPYNQDYDDDHCAYCGADLPDDVTGLSEEVESAIMDGFCNPEHFDLYEKHGPSGAPIMSSEDKDRYNALRVRWYEANATKPSPATLADVLSYLPDGDFNWEAQEAEDWHVYNCGEKDCPVGWHLVAYTEDYRRENGVLTVALNSCDTDGNWDVYGEWSSNADAGDDFGSSVGWALGERRTREYFLGWADYWLDCALSGEDPCDQVLAGTALMRGEWAHFCLDAAEDNLKYISKSHATR